MATNQPGETEVLKRFYSQIESVLDPAEVAQLLWQNGVLTDDQLDNAKHVSSSSSQRRSEVMTAVRKVVNGDPKKLWVLIDTLEQFPASAPVASKMREALKSECSDFLVLPLYSLY